MEAARTRMGPVWAVLAARWDELVTEAGDVAWRCRGSVSPPGWGLRFQQIRQSGWRGTQMCDCYPFGYTAGTLEGPQEHCRVHGREDAS